MMADGAGFVVKDIGVDQNVEKFQTAADEFHPDILGMSALLTTTMTYMKTVIDGFSQPGYDHIKMTIGGLREARRRAKIRGGYAAGIRPPREIPDPLVARPAGAAQAVGRQRRGEGRAAGEVRRAHRRCSAASRPHAGRAYSAQFRWGDEQERTGSIDEVSAAVVRELSAW